MKKDRRKGDTEKERSSRKAAQGRGERERENQCLRGSEVAKTEKEATDG